MRTTRTRLLGVLVAVVLVGAACGDDDSTTAIASSGDDTVAEAQQEPPDPGPDGGGDEPDDDADGGAVDVTEDDHENDADEQDGGEELPAATPVDGDDAGGDGDVETPDVDDAGSDDGAERPEADDASSDDGAETPEADDASSDHGAERPEADVVVDVGFDGSTVAVADDRIEVNVGSTVALVVTSEVADHIHLHGYDLFVDVVPGVPAVMTFTADIPGLFEVEFEDSGRFIAELAVR